jgi:hypothetical protein
MPNAASLKRQRLFDIYSKNLSFYATAGDVVGQFLCPLCFNLFPPDALTSSPPKVDLAHLYPRACGGNLETLTCRQCNNRIGRLYDKHLAIEREVALAVGGTGKGTTNAIVEFPWGTARGPLRIEGNNIQFHMRKEWTNPKTWEDFDRQRPGVGTDTEIKFTFAHHDWRRVGVALVHSAYLTMFHYFGYEYAAGANCNQLLEMFASDKPPEKLPMQIAPVPHNARFSNGLGAKDIINRPVAALVDGVKVMGVVLPSPHHHMVARVVYLPGFGAEAAEDYRKLMTSARRRVSATVIPISRASNRWLGEKKHIGHGHRLFAAAFGHEGERRG